jgi:hypothetical protein
VRGFAGGTHSRQSNVPEEEKVNGQKSEETREEGSEESDDDEVVRSQRKLDGKALRSRRGAFFIGADSLIGRAGEGLFVGWADQRVGAGAAGEAWLWREMLGADVGCGFLDDFLGVSDLLGVASGRYRRIIQ